MGTRIAISIGVGLLAAGCGYTEDALEHRDLKGTLIVPKDAATFDFLTPEDELITISGDPRGLGPWSWPGPLGLGLFLDLVLVLVLGLAAAVPSGMLGL